jgi:hypothetical protein
MSYFLFGVVRFVDKADEELDEFSWQIVGAGSDLRVFVLVGPNVMQPPVRDILRERDLLGADCLAFMVTGSPLRDTSHELISPCREDGGDLIDIRESLGRVGTWLERLSRFQGVLGIQLFTSEGYDTNFAECESSPAGIVDEIMRRLEGEGDVPSLRIHVTLPG